MATPPTCWGTAVGGQHGEDTRPPITREQTAARDAALREESERVIAHYADRQHDAVQQSVIGSRNGIYGTACSSGSFHLGTGEFHHFGPLVTFLGNQFRKIGGRH